MSTISKWDYRFIELAQMVSTWSKDPCKKVGAIVVLDRRIIQSGILRVVSPEIVPSNWSDNQTEAKEYMEDSGIVVDHIKLSPEYTI